MGACLFDCCRLSQTAGPGGKFQAQCAKCHASAHVTPKNRNENKDMLWKMEFVLTFFSKCQRDPTGSTFAEQPSATVQLGCG